MSIIRNFEFRNKICDSSYIYVYVYIYVYILYIFLLRHILPVLHCSRGNSTFRMVRSTTRVQRKMTRSDANILFLLSFSYSRSQGHDSRFSPAIYSYHRYVYCTYLQKRTRSIFFVCKSFSSCKIIYIHLLYRYTKNMYNLVRIYATSTTRALHDSLQLLRIENEIKLLAHGFRSPITRK